MNKLEKKFRALQIYNGILMLALVVVIASGFQKSHQKIQELDVERSEYRRAGRQGENRNYK